MKSKKNIARNLLSLILALSLLIPCAAAYGTVFTQAAPQALEEGTYRIRNVSSGLYMGVYKYNAKSPSSARVIATAYNASDLGECFYLKNAGNDCWQLISKGETDDYYVSCESGTEAGSAVTKKKTADTSCLFDISLSKGNYFTIAPSFGDNIRAVLAAGTEKNGNDVYLQTSDYSSASTAQLWTFEPVTTTGISVAYKKTRVKLYSTERFYAALQPSGINATSASWKSSDENVLLMSEDGYYCALAPGKVTVTVTAEGQSAHFDVEVCDSDAFTWFSQNNISQSDWDASMIGEMRWYSMGVTKRFMCDSKSGANYDNWMDIGCAECCISMVLHNLGATMKKGFDLRTGQEGGLAADPFTVAMANTGNYDIRDFNQVVYGNPCYMSWKYVSDAFFVDGEPMGYVKINTQSKAKLRELLEKHPGGLIAQMSRGGNTHYIVIAKCVNPEEKDASKLEFLYYDPAGYLPDEADGVPFEKTTSYRYMSYRFVNINAIIIYDVASNLK